VARTSKCQVIAVKILALALLALSCKSTVQRQGEDSSLRIIDESLVDVDLLKKGSFTVSEIDYASDPAVDERVVPSTASNGEVIVDVRGRLYLPNGKGPFPVVVLVHGNHATCGISGGEGNPRFDINSDFTSTGTCPPGYMEVPSHLGYQASARHLASWGYAVIAINANRGITSGFGPDYDAYLDRARGAQVLRHLEELRRLSSEGKNPFLKLDNPSLQGKFDLSHVGLMGHSRGGLGVRMAHNLYTSSFESKSWQDRNPGLKIRAVMEIGSVDDWVKVGEQKMGQIEARNVAWTLVIPGCDYDVHLFPSIDAFIRMLPSADGHPKSIFTVWGSNHNFFNSEWQVSDAPHECSGGQKPLWDTTGAPLPIPSGSARPHARVGLTGSPAQIAIEQSLLLAFFRANLSGDKALGHVFDPQYRLPKQLSSLAKTSREYHSGLEGKIVFEGKASEVKAAPEGGLKAVSSPTYISEQLAQVNRSWNAYAARQNLGPFVISINGKSTDREALAIYGKATEDQDIILPLKSEPSTQGYWTLDLLVSLRSECYDFDDNLRSTCPTMQTGSDFKVSLIRGDGVETKAVSAADYIDLASVHKSSLVWGVSGGILAKDPDWKAAPQTNRMLYLQVPVVYQTMRLELSDFQLRDAAIKGIKLHFAKGSSPSMLIESARLSRRP